MTAPVADKVPGWEAWLRKYQLWDEDKSIEELYLRYRKFEKLSFDQVPEEHWGQLFQDLLFFEDGLVFGNSIGCVDEFPFKFNVEDETPLREKPIQYAREERNWIEEYLTDLEELGVVRRINPGDPEPTFAVNAVLVKDGQSQQRYRLCANMIPVNTRVSVSALPLNECLSSLDQLQGLLFKSIVDIKAGYLNIPICKFLQKFVGLVTQDSLFVFLRMVFGFHLAPAFFQGVMNWALRQARFPIRHGVYLDDCPIGGNTWQEAWAATLEAMRCLLCLGLPINIWKCQFLQVELAILGWVLRRDDFYLGRKAMAKLFSTQIPQNLQQLQSLLGRLNFASLFLVDYKQIVSPLIDLMGGKSDHRWTEKHTQALNELGRAVWERLRLAICDPKLPITMHVDAGDTFGAIALVQEQEGGQKLVALAGKRLQVMEMEGSQLEKLLMTTLWGLKRYQKYTSFCSKMVVALPHQAEVQICRMRNPPLKVQARLIELSSFNVMYEWGQGALTMGQELGEALSGPPDPSDEELSYPSWEHMDITLEMPGKLPSGETRLGDLILHFDGASAKGQVGAGGYIVQDRLGSCLVGGGRYYGPKHSNNVAEARAMIDGLAEIPRFITPMVKEVVIKGDSDLIIGFMTRRFKPKKKELALMVKRAWEQVKSWRTVRAHFFHVPREFNQAADWMSKVARVKEASLDLRDLTTCMKDGQWVVQPPLNLVGPGVEGGQLTLVSSSVDHLHASWDEEEPGEEEHAVIAKCEKCKVCNKAIETRVYECGGCATTYHGKCLPMKELPLRLGPWHCKVCRTKFFKEGLRDITLDEPLLTYLSHQQLPDDVAMAARVIKAARYACMDKSGGVWVAGGDEDSWRRVPIFHQRRNILLSCLTGLGFPNGERLYAALRGQFWWHGMMADCVETAYACLPRQQERATFKAPRFLFPVPKPAAPFRLWAIDCLTNLTPVAPDGSADVIIAVDPFSKWVEIGRLPVLNSHHTAEWFHQQVVCRYGLPMAVRSDQGREFLGSFSRYLKLHGILHLPIIAKNPRANGQVERYVREVKRGLRMFTAHCEGSQWWDLLQDIARGLRVIPTRATGYAPFVLAFKQQPILHFPHAIRTLSEQDWITKGSKEVEELSMIWQDILGEVQQRLKRGDEAMVKAYHRRQDLAELDVRFIFKGGDMVFLRQKDPGKLKLKSTGPYIFINYMGHMRIKARIMNLDNHVFEVSAGNLLPVDPPATRMVRFAPDTTPDADSPAFPSIDSPFASSLSSPSTPRMPPGTHLEPGWGDLQPSASPRRKVSRGGKLS